jgi:RND family efflux transporter MFP subunit
VVPAQLESISEVRHLIGRGVLPEGAGVTVSAPFDCQVVRLLVSPDTEVEPDALLAEVEPTPAARAEIDVASVQVDSAADQLEAVQAAFDRRLTTNDAVLRAQGELATARARLRALRRSGVDGHAAELDAPEGGLVRDLTASEGTWLATGAPLLRLVRPDEIEALVGLEPRDTGRVRIGDTISLTALNGAFTAVAGEVTAVATQVDPSTGTIGVHVAVPAGTPVLDGQPIEGEVSFPAEPHLIVPHAALVPREAGFAVFALEGADRVREVQVTVAFEVGDRAALDAPALTDGTPVVMEGDYSLADGMRVRVRP